jgi:exodeoxyribonuclease VII small subunit
MTKKNALNFENTLDSLTRIAESLELGELSLEDSLKNFEDGIKLTRSAQKGLQDAEQKVQLLLEDGNESAAHLEEQFVGKDEDTL